MSTKIAQFLKDPLIVFFKNLNLLKQRQDGLAALEFALILPVLLILFIIS